MARDGKAAAFLSIEGAELLPDRPDALDNAYEAGVRLLTVTWNYRSRFGARDARSGGGVDERRAGAGARLCGQGGIIVDVSHLSEQGFWDVCGDD